MLRRVFCLAAFATLAMPAAVAWADDDFDDDDDDDDDDSDAARHRREEARREEHRAYCKQLQDQRDDVYSDYENADDPELRKELRVRQNELEDEIFRHCS